MTDQIARDAPAHSSSNPADPMARAKLECHTLRTKVAMPTCTLHHDAGAPPCPCCETPHARTCAPWEGVEAHEFDCACPLCREAWLLSDTDSEELYGVAMRSRCDEWEPNWSDEALTRDATSQEILDEWQPECWFKDEEELARSAAHPHVHLLLSPRPSLSLRPSTASSPPSLSQEEAHDEEHEEAREQARLDRTLLPHTRGCFRVHLTPAAHPLYAARTLHVRYTPTARTPARPPARPHALRPHSHLLLAQVRLIQRALLGEETRDEALEETKLVTPIKKKEGGRHVHQPVDEGGPNALSSTTARQPTRASCRRKAPPLACGCSAHSEDAHEPSRSPRRGCGSTVSASAQASGSFLRATPGRRSGSGRRDRHFQEEEAAGAVRVRCPPQEEGVPAPPAWQTCPGSALLALCLPRKRTCSRSLLAAGAAKERGLCTGPPTCAARRCHFGLESENGTALTHRS